MAYWQPWRGCHRCSEGCRFCYIHKGDAKRGVDTDQIVKTDRFDAPVQRYVRGERKGQYKMQAGSLVYLCFSSDFLLPDADPWRPDCWAMIRQRPDLHFLFLTKRIDRFAACAPPDWGDGYENVTVGCTVENRATAEYRLELFDRLPIRHKNIICQPLLSPIDLRGHLRDVELVVAGGEADRCARPLDFAWVLAIRAQCVDAGVAFRFRQCGSLFLKDGITYRIPTRQLMSQAQKADIDI